MSNYFIENQLTNIYNEQFQEMNITQLFNTKKKQHSDSLNCIFNCGKYQLIITLKNKNQQVENIILSSYTQNITSLFFYDIISDELLSQICNEEYSKKLFSNNNKITNESQIFQGYDFNQKCNILIFSHVKFPLFYNINQYNNKNNKSCCILFIIDNKKNGDYIFTTKDLKNCSEIILKFNGTIHNQNFIKNDIEIILTPDILMNSLYEYLYNNKKTYFSNDELFLVKINIKRNGFNNLAVLFGIKNKFNLDYESIISDNILIKKIFIGIDIFKYSNDTIKNSLNSSTELSNTYSDDSNIQNNIYLYDNKINNIDNINSFDEADTVNIFRTSSDKLTFTDNTIHDSYENSEYFQFNDKNNEKIKINIINKLDEFNLAIFNKYKINNYVCNFSIFKENIDISKTYIKSKKNYKLDNFLKIFKGVGIFPLSLPLINNKGYKEISHFNPSFSSMVLYLENENIFNYFIKLFDNSNSFITNGFIITKFSEKIIKIEYDEKKYPSEREILDTKIIQLINIFKKINISKDDIIIDKSFLSILWNPSNNYKIQTSFLSYYSFDLNLIGILAIKLDENKWFDYFTEKKEIEIKYCYKEYESPLFKNDYYSGVDNINNLLDEIEKYEQMNEKIKPNSKILDWKSNFRDFTYYIKNSN